MEEKENRHRRGTSQTPESDDHQLHASPGDQAAGAQREADRQVAFHAEGGDVQDGGICTGFAQVELEAAQEVSKGKGPIPPQTIEIQG